MEGPVFSLDWSCRIRMLNLGIDDGQALRSVQIQVFYKSLNLACYSGENLDIPGKHLVHQASSHKRKAK